MSLPVVLIADKLAESTVAALGDQVEVRWVDGPDREKLLAAVPDADAHDRFLCSPSHEYERSAPPNRSWPGRASSGRLWSCLFINNTPVIVSTKNRKNVNPPMHQVYERAMPLFRTETGCK